MRPGTQTGKAITDQSASMPIGARSVMILWELPPRSLGIDPVVQRRRRLRDMQGPTGIHASRCPVQLPGRSTDRYGLMVQRDDTAVAWRKSEFDSRWVH